MQVNLTNGEKSAKIISNEEKIMKLNNNDEESPKNTCLDKSIKSWTHLDNELQKYMLDNPDIDTKYIKRIAKIVELYIHFLKEYKKVFYNNKATNAELRYRTDILKLQSFLKEELTSMANTCYPILFYTKDYQLFFYDLRSKVDNINLNWEYYMLGKLDTLFYLNKKNYEFMNQDIIKNISKRDLNILINNIKLGKWSSDDTINYLNNIAIQDSIKNAQILTKQLSK